MLEMMIGTASRRRFSVIDPSVSGALGRATLTASAGAATDIPPQGGKDVSEPGSSHFLNHVSAPDKRRCLKVSVSSLSRSASVAPALRLGAIKPERMSLPPLCLFSDRSAGRRLLKGCRFFSFCTTDGHSLRSKKRNRRGGRRYGQKCIPPAIWQSWRAPCYCSVEICQRSRGVGHPADSFGGIYSVCQT